MTLTNRLLPFVALALLCVLCYGNTAAGYFCCDEQLFLGFMHQVHTVGPMNLLWTIFATKVSQVQPLLDCYRPFPDVVWLAEYVFGGTNPVWYHATNISLHIGSAFFAFVIMERLAKRCGFDEQAGRWIAFFTAALSATFPLTSEAVCSPTNITTLVCTFCFYGAIASYLVCQDADGRRGSAAPTVISVILFALGLLSKEMCAALPVVLCAMEWGRSDFRKTLLRTAPFWIVLVAYLALRVAVLGPIIGGYHGSLGEEAARINGTIHRLFGPWPSILLFPINKHITPEALKIALSAALLACYTALAALFMFKKRSAEITFKPLLTAFLPWLALAALTTITVWNLEPGLAGGRHLYVLTVPIFGLLVATSFTANSRAWLITYSALLTVFFTTTVFDNDQYVTGTKQSQAVRVAIQKQLAQMPASQSLVLIKPPFQSNGTYLFSSSNMLHAMCSPPLTSPDLDGRVKLLNPWFNMNHGLFPTSRLRKLSASTDNKLMIWDEKEMQLKPFDRRFGDPDLNIELTPVASHFDQTSNLSVLTFNADRKHLAEDTTFVEVVLKSKPLKEQKKVRPAISMVWGENKDDVLFLPVIDDGTAHTYRFPVGIEWDWLLSQQTGTFEIRLPSPYYENTVDSVRLIGSARRVPAVRLAGARLNEDNDGVVTIPKEAPLEFQFDASKVASAATVLVEISHKDGLLEEGTAFPWRQKPSKKFLKRMTFGELTGSIPLNPSDFREPGVYEMEAGTLDKSGVTGFFSDPIFVRRL